MRIKFSDIKFKDEQTKDLANDLEKLIIDD